MEKNVIEDIINAGQVLTVHELEKPQHVIISSIQGSGNDGFKLFDILEFSEEDRNKEAQNLCNIGMDIFGNNGMMYFLLVAKKQKRGIIFCLSGSYRTRAGDLVRFLTENHDYVEYEFETEEPAVSCAFSRFDSEYSQQKIVEDYANRTQEYFQNCDLIDATTYTCSADRVNAIARLPVYVKKKLPRAYVKSLDIASTKDSICLKTLENKSGVKFIPSEEIFIMIGSSGETYDIRKEKFNELYIESDVVSVEEFVREFDMQPVAKIAGGKEISLIDYAHVCIPQKANCVYAKKLSRITKVFSVKKPQEYYLGMSGDYIIIDVDDLTGIHIVREEVLTKTYEKVG